MSEPVISTRNGVPQEPTPAPKVASEPEEKQDTPDTEPLPKPTPHRSHHRHKS